MQYHNNFFESLVNHYIEDVVDGYIKYFGDDIDNFDDNFNEFASKISSSLDRAVHNEEVPFEKKDIRNFSFDEEIYQAVDDAVNYDEVPLNQVKLFAEDLVNRKDTKKAFYDAIYSNYQLEYHPYEYNPF